jgi:hypothetical protein
MSVTRPRVPLREIRSVLLLRRVLVVALAGMALAAHRADAQILRDYYSEAGIPAQRDTVSGHLADRVDPFTGKLQLHHIDLVVPGNGGLDIRIVRSGGRDLSPAQRALMAPGEVAAKLPGAHAEVTALEHAARNGLTPAELAVSRAICPTCRAAIGQSGGQLTSPTTAIWPR